MFLRSLRKFRFCSSKIVLPEDTIPIHLRPYDELKYKVILLK